MNLRHLEIFHAIATAGSITGAARILHVSQPAVSAALKHAESHLKMKLFQRTPTGLQATAEAAALFPHVTDVFQRVDTLRKLADALRDGHSGQVRVATTSSLLDIFLPKTIARLKQSSPNVKVVISMLPKSFVIDRVAQRYADVGLIYGAADESGVDAEELAVTELSCALPRGHELASKRYITAQDLKDQPLIQHGRYTTMGSLIDVMCEKALEHPAVSIEHSSCITACLMVSAGAGIALVDSSIVKAAKHVGDVVLKPFRPTIKLKTQLIFPRSTPRSIAMQAFVRELRKLTA